MLKMGFLKLNLFIFICSVSGVLSFVRREACEFEVDVESLNFPLIWNSHGVLHPRENENGKWILELESGEKFNAGCSGNGNLLKSFGKSNVEVECIKGQIIKTDGLNLRNFDELICAEQMSETAERNGTCWNGFTNIDIRFDVPENPWIFISACHDESTSETIYTKHVLEGGKLDEQESSPRPDFKEGGFYPEIDTDDCYKQVQQTNAVAELVGSRDLALQYIQTGKNLFMARGHFAPNGDGIYAYEKRATFYFINASPQWQTVNGGNWEVMESAIRTLAKAKRAQFNIWTGSYNHTSLNDINGNPVEIWLGQNDGNLLRRLPVAHLTWKVIQDEAAGTGIAIIQMNNPWASISSFEICPSVCPLVSWIKWPISDVVKGYTICCSVNDFKKAIPYAPDLGNLPLLM